MQIGEDRNRNAVETIAVTLGKLWRIFFSLYENTDKRDYSIFAYRMRHNDVCSRSEATSFRNNKLAMIGLFSYVPIRSDRSYNRWLY